MADEVRSRSPLIDDGVPAIFRAGRVPAEESCSLCQERAGFFASLNYFDYRTEDLFCADCLDRAIEQSGPIIEFVIPIAGENGDGMEVTAAEFLQLLRGEPVVHGLSRRVITFEDAPFKVVERGGPGSGHHGHEGRPGEVGGSKPSDGDDAADDGGDYGGVYGPPIPDQATDEQVAKYDPAGSNNFRIVGITDLSDAEGRLIGPGQYADAVSQIMKEFYRRTGFAMRGNVVSNEWIALAEAGAGDFGLSSLFLSPDEMADRLQDGYENELYGAYVQSESTLFISPNTRLMRPDQERFSFVVSHELGHWLQNRVDLTGIQPSEEYFGAMNATYGGGQSLQEEYVSDLIAAHVLDGEVYRFYREPMNWPLNSRERSDAEEVVDIIKRAPVLRSDAMVKRADDLVLVFIPQAGEIIEVPRARLSELPPTAEIFGDRLDDLEVMRQRVGGLSISDAFAITDPQIPLDPGGMGMEFHQPTEFDPKTVDPAYIYASLSMSPPLMDLQRYVLEQLDEAGGAYDAQEPERFHITLLYIDRIDNWQLHDMISNIQFPAAFTVEGIRLGTFKEADDKPLVLMINPDNALLRVQRELYERAMQMGLEVSPFNRPGHYKPHVTLAYDMEPADQRLPKLEKPLRLTVDSIAVTRPDYRMARVIRLPTLPGGAAFVIRRDEPDMFERMRRQRQSAIARAFGDLRHYFGELVGGMIDRNADNERDADRQSVERHYGPGEHPGTGTDQDIHAGAGAALADPVEAVSEALVEDGWRTRRVADVDSGDIGRGWLLPDGRFVDINGSHDGAAGRALNAAGVPRINDPLFHFPHATPTLIKMGFVRMAFDSAGAWFDTVDDLTPEGAEFVARLLDLRPFKSIAVDWHSADDGRLLDATHDDHMARDQLERAISNAYRTINRTWTPEYRHYGPGEHPGTGTDQQAHAGDGAAATDVADRPKAGTSPEGQSGGGAWLADMAAGMKKPGLYEVADQGEQLKAFGQRLFDIGEAIENRPQGQGALPPDIAKYLQYSIGRHQFAFQQSQDSSDPNAPLESVSGEALNKSFDAVAGALEMYEFEMARHKLTPSFEELTALQEIRSALGTHRGPEFDPEDEFYDLTVEMANHTFERAPLTTDDPGRLALFEQPWFQRQAMELLENGDVEAWTVRAPWAEGFEDGQVVPDVITLARQADVLGSSDYHPDVKSFYFDVFRHLADVPGTPEAAYMIGQFGGEWRFQLDNLIMRYAPGQWVPPDEAKYGEGVEQVVDYVNTAWTESARHPASIALMEEVSRQFGGMSAPESDDDDDYYVSEWGEEFTQEPADMPTNSSEILAGYVQRTYETTQQWLADRGYRPGDTVRLYRGMRTMTGEWNPTGEPGPADVGMWALSSWTSESDTAYDFASMIPEGEDPGDDEPGAIIAADIPIERLFANSDTGMPSKQEAEWLVFGKDSIAGTIYEQDTIPDVLQWGMPWDADLGEVVAVQADYKGMAWDEHMKRAENTTVQRAGGLRRVHVDEGDADWLKVLAHERARKAEIDAMNEQSPIEVKGMLRRVAVNRGGPGSGHHGHQGRPGKIGGSQPGTATDQVVPAGSGARRKGIRTIIDLEQDREGLPELTQAEIEAARAEGGFGEALYTEEGAVIYDDREAFTLAAMRQIAAFDHEIAFMIDDRGYVSHKTGYGINSDWIKGTQFNVTVTDEAQWAYRISQRHGHNPIFIHSHPMDGEGRRSSPPSAADLYLAYARGVYNQRVAARDGYYEFSFSRTATEIDREEIRQIADIWDEDNPSSSGLADVYSKGPTRGIDLPAPLRDELYDRQHARLTEVAEQMPDLFSYGFVPWDQ